MIELNIEGIKVQVSAEDAERLQRLFADGAQALANQPDLLTRVNAVDHEKTAVRRLVTDLVARCATLLDRVDGEEAVRDLATKLASYKTPT